ncbi:MAG: glycosyltransferase family 4 protein [Planctomycetota bacterium]
MRIALVCHYFAPEPGAPQARLEETARTWVRDGHDVTVLTGFPNHPDGVLAAADRGRLFRAEERDGIRVLRSWLFATPNRGVLKKTLGHLSFMATAALVGGARARRPDVVVVSSPTFFSVFAAAFLARRWGCPWVFEVRDLWPAIFTELGVLTNRTAIGILTRLELALYRRATRVVTVTDGFRENIVGRGIEPGRVVTITNGVDTRRFAPVADRAEIRDRLGVADRFVVLYLGAHGVSHALGRMLDVAARWRDDPSALFRFVGEGAEKRGLEARAAAEGLTNVEFLPAVQKDEVADLYHAADVCLVPLRDVPLFSTFLPSKMFEIMGCGRPVLASVRGEAAEILARSGGAVVVPPEDVGSIDRALRELRESPERRREMGRAGADFVRRHYDREVLATRYADLLSKIVAGGAA